MKIFLLLIVSFIVLSCDKGAKTPEGLLSMYIKDLTSSQIDKDYFEKYTTGELWERVEGLDEEEFKKFVDLSKVKNPEIDITNKNCIADKCTLTYIIKYDVMEKDKKSFGSEVKKIATLVKSGDIWKISDVTNVKSYFEAESAIDVLPED
ncbi:MAG: hypothetical protein QF441_14620 [Bacteriovoracaceae bacterium]|jgi:hypothetical protein|nr:hypothetical protein [Halobacteriovoraceae bacterium]MDP7321838.1 hypothetical protein [Bacteriovoracaceae bacterium]